MKELVVISGKGGTGKTSLVAAFAALAEKKVLVDCDVDAADLHLVLNPLVERQEAFSGGEKASVVEPLCTGCGICAELCRYEALSPHVNADGRTRFAVDPIACEGCGLCARLCTAGAIRFEPVVSGQWFVSSTDRGPMVHARLGIAQANSGKLVSLLRREARELAQRESLPLMIVDGSPGIGCPVIASVTGADLVLAVTEPTCSGFHDIQRVIELAGHFQVPLLLCVNKWDINPSIAHALAWESRKRRIPFAGRVRYDPVVTQAQIRKMSVVEYTKDAVAEDIKALWSNVMNALD
jgi:MinD superfamily P-loop ATPase